MRYEMIFKCMYVCLGRGREREYVVTCREFPFDFVVYSATIPYTVYRVLLTQA